MAKFEASHQYFNYWGNLNNHTASLILYKQQWCCSQGYGIVVWRGVHRHFPVKKYLKSQKFSLMMLPNASKISQRFCTNTTIGPSQNRGGGTGGPHSGYTNDKQNSDQSTNCDSHKFQDLIQYVQSLMQLLL